MNFQISGLKLAPFAPLFALSTEELAARGVVRAHREPQARVSLPSQSAGR